jgi:hypothetical protein
LNQKLLKALAPLQVLFYISFVFLWFKDNIPPLRAIPVPEWIPLILLGAALLIWFILRFKLQKRRIHLSLSKISMVLMGILLLTVVLRIPYLLHGFGLTTSDDAIPILMGKHISEGKIPPINYYGQLYLGSLSSQVFALMFRVFGYSIFVLKASTLLFYLGFITVHFFLVKKIFSFDFAWISSFFYSLPIGHLVSVSFDNTPYSLVLLLGASLLYMSYLVSYEKKEHWIPWVGFLAGLSFWTYQITITFILTSLVFLIFKARLPLKKYASLFFYSLVGGMPLLMQEIYEKFQLLRFLSPGKMKMKVVSGEKLGRAAKFTASLLSKENHWISFLFLFLIVLGVLFFAASSLKKKSFLPFHIYTFYFVVFYLVYLLSDFGNIRVIRYFNPLYFCLPVLLLAPFWALRSRWKSVFSFVFILFLFIVFNLRGSYTSYLAIRDLHHNLSRVVECMEGTGKKYWQGDYWTAYLVTAIAKEKLIVDSYNFNRYPPYRLDYYNQDQNENFIFLRGPDSRERRSAVYLTDLLQVCGVRYKKKVIGECWLVYDIENPVTPRIFLDPMVMETPVPARLPQLKLTQIRSSKGYLQLIFTNEDIGESPPFRVYAEIPGYSQRARVFSLGDREVELRIPFPPENSFKINYFVDYLGFKIGSSVRETIYSPPVAEWGKKGRVAYLSGFGPETSFFGKKMKVCEKEAILEIFNPRKRKMKVSFSLYSPLQFSHTYWYGKYSQEVEISVNGHPLGKVPLKDGENMVGMVIESSFWKPGANRIALDFKYHLPLGFAPTWRTAALLEKIMIEKGETKKSPPQKGEKAKPSKISSLKGLLSKLD